MYGEGIVHHTAFQVADYDVQSTVKFHLEGLGFTDVSERKDRGYFESIYVRTPGGALFEATVSKPEGFLIDEPYEELGRDLPGASGVRGPAGVPHLLPGAARLLTAGRLEGRPAAPGDHGSSGRPTIR